MNRDMNRDLNCDMNRDMNVDINGNVNAVLTGKWSNKPPEFGSCERVARVNRSEWKVNGNEWGR